MKALGYIAAIVGVLMIIGVPGNADFYEECKAAADCVAGEPQSILSMLAQLFGGILLVGAGSLWAYVWSE